MQLIILIILKITSIKYYKVQFLNNNNDFIDELCKNSDYIDKNQNHNDLVIFYSLNNDVILACNENFFENKDWEDITFYIKFFDLEYEYEVNAKINNNIIFIKNTYKKHI